MKAHKDRQLTSEEFMQPRKDNEARKEGRLACAYSGTCEDAVESNPQVKFKSPSEYVRIAIKAHKDRQLTVDKFMQATGLSLSTNVVSIVLMVL